MPPAISVVVSNPGVDHLNSHRMADLAPRGTIRMTRPTAIYFGADESVDSSPKVYIWVFGEASLARGSGLYVG